MSILIKNMDMPKSCFSCPFVTDELADNSVICPYIKEYVGVGYKSKNCPLIELPPHGRLIDGDALAAECDAPHWCVWLSEIYDAPTIIESEGEE